LVLGVFVLCSAVCASPLTAHSQETFDNMVKIYSHVHASIPWAKHHHRQPVHAMHAIAFNITEAIHNNTIPTPTPTGVAPESTPPPDECQTKLIKTNLKWMANESCAELLIIMASDFDERACHNPCWKTVIADTSALYAAGCIDVDGSEMDTMCQQSDCGSEEAVQCIEDWVAGGCADDIPYQCYPYAPCTTAARQAGRCELPPISPVPDVHPSNRTIRNETEAVPYVPIAPSPSVIVRTCTHLRNCSRNGDCINGSCVCHKGYGRHTESALQDCSEWTMSSCPDMCYGHGDCVPANGTMACRCFEGYSGKSCDTWLGCGNLNFCSGNGECVKAATRSLDQCRCAAGYTGPTCATPTFPCVQNCSAHGTCAFSEATQAHACECAAGYSGPDCSVVTGSCPNSCSGRGLCEAGNCSCSEGFSGSACSTAVNMCGNCNKGTCSSETCECSELYYGPACASYNASADTACVALNFCSGFGVCQADGQGGASCTCFEGFGGIMCNQVENVQGCPSFCSGHGRCSLVQSPHCVCDSGYGGIACNESACGAATNGKTCNGKGVCEVLEEGGTHECVCDDGWSGDSCEEAACAEDCNGHGTCVGDSGTPTCQCDSGFAGPTCQVVAVTMAILQQPLPVEDDEAVDLLPCLNGCSAHGTCSDGSCSCMEGYVGEDCSIAPVGTEMDDVSDLYALLQEGEGRGEAQQARVVEEEIIEGRRSMAALWD